MAENDDLVTVTLQIARSALTVQEPPAELLSQENVMAVCGIPELDPIRWTGSLNWRLSESLSLARAS